MKRLLALGAAVAAIGLFAAPAQAGAPEPVPQRASDWIWVQCGAVGEQLNDPLNYPARPASEGQETAQDAFNSHGGAVALGETCDVYYPNP
jgi:hypothetical protein